MKPEDGEYNMKDLHSDIWALYRAGLIEARMREDGEWIFNVSEIAAKMSEVEIRTFVENLDDYDIVDEDNG